MWILRRFRKKSHSCGDFRWLLCFAIVNVQNHHGTAIVKHVGNLWDVDSLVVLPRLLDEHSFGVLVGQHYAFVVELEESACSIDAQIPEREAKNRQQES